MTPASFDLALQLGNTLARTFRFKDGDGNVVDLTGAEIVFRAELRGAELIRISTEDDLAMPDPTTGEVTMTLLPAETRAIPLGRIVRYELEHWLDGVETTLMEGFMVGSGGVNDDEAMTG